MQYRMGNNNNNDNNVICQIQKRQSSGSMDDRPLMWARDYVESLHQNSRATLLFGKNNVLVQPVRLFISCLMQW